MAMHIGAAEVHVWLTRVDHVRPDDLEAYETILDSDERGVNQRFHFQTHRRLHLVAHALVRDTLSRYADSIDVADWRFVRNRYGRPSVDPTRGMPLIPYNLSHTDGLVACAVAATDEVGVDVERMRRVTDLGLLARDVYSDVEIGALEQLPEGELRHRRFHELWTLKEAYIKARGLGLSLSTASFDVLLDGPALSVRLDPDGGVSSSEWTLALFAPSPEHRLAVAVRIPAAALRVAYCVPLRGPVDAPPPTLLRRSRLE